MSKVKVTQVKSKNSATKKQEATLLTLGIHRIHQSVEIEMNPVYKGMVDKVLHLVKVEVIN
ncbi:MAG: 50S ribosomal protein L30 [Bacteroidetes bacterium HGW-Bacteroidetes-8]|jgi:large subunit ribosomal protein L30|nr:MAG: 50S ribosomal protein L30 [Bacteroidetes bacterium HGW-Bacteroidetes-8]